MKPTLNTLITLCVLLLVANGCSLVNQVKKQGEKPTTPKVIKSTDGKSQLTVPGNWDVKTNLNEVASIQVANLAAEQYTVVITDDKEDFTSEMTLDGYTDLIRKNTEGLLKDPVLGPNKPLTVNGYPAMQFQAEGSFSNIKAIWLYTIVDAPKNYHQIMAWTMMSRFEKNRPVFDEVVASFKETEGIAGSESATTK